MGCTPNMITSVIKKYGEGDVLSYAKAFIGEDLMTGKFQGIKDTIEKQFKAKGQAIPFGIMDKVNRAEKD